MPYLKIHEKRLYYQFHRATEAAPKLLLVHGAGGDHLNWPAALRNLPGIAVYSLDLPGHGRSQPPARQSVRAYADDLEAFIRALALPQVTICGHSMGGAIAMTLALRHLPELTGLVLVGTGARLRVSDQILGQIHQDYDAAIATILRYSWSQDAPARLVEADRQAKLRTIPEVLHADYLACHNFDIMAQIGDIQLPTLVISGSADQLTPEKYGQYLANHISQASHVTITGGGHMMAMEQPRPVADAIAEFLRQL